MGTTNQKKLFLKAFYAFVMTVAFGCANSSDGLAPSAATTLTPAVPAIGNPALTAAQVSGSHVAPCLVASGGTYGTDVNGMSFYRSLTLNSDTSFVLSTYLFTGSVCQFGGTEIFAYSQFGTYALGAIMTAPAGATQITFSISSSSVTMYALPGGGVGSTWAGYFNSYCPGGPTTFSTTGTSSFSEAGHQCMHLSSPAFTFPIFPANGSVYYDAILLDSNTAPTKVNLSASNSIFHAGQISSYPTATGLIYTF